jgi:hypothetical protein
MEGWLTNVTFIPSTSVFRSLHLCSCFSLLIFSFPFLFLLSPLSLSVLVLLVSLYIICVCLFFVCVFLYYVFVVLPSFVAFVCSSWFLWVCIWLVGSTTVGEGKLKFPFAGGRSQVSLPSLCLCFSSPLPLRLCVLWSLQGKRMPLHLSLDSVEISTVQSCLIKKRIPITGLLVSHRGGEILDRDVTMICCRFLWIGGMKEMNSLLKGWFPCKDGCLLVAWRKRESLSCTSTVN